MSAEKMLNYIYKRQINPTVYVIYKGEEFIASTICEKNAALICAALDAYTPPPVCQHDAMKPECTLILGNGLGYVSKVRIECSVCHSARNF